MINDVKEIYDFLDNNILEIIKKLESKSDDEDFEKVKLEVLKIIKVFQEEKLNKGINELKENQEWDKFAVAFYGETKAGKSTIIESLRIYFKEKEKFEQQREFRTVLRDYQQNINELETQIDSNRIEISDFEIKNETLINDFKVEKGIFESKLNEITIEDTNKKQSSLIYKILSFLHFINVNKKIDEIKKILEEKEINFNEEIKKIEITLDAKRNKILDIEKSMKELEENSFNLLQNLSDGQIIGDYTSDFTKESKSYNFKYNDQEFIFLDVPGIEGNESKVINEISSAVKKAHAVFYVTDKKPQEGTLNKIKEHLGSQTEIYTIFNKRINDPIQLALPLIKDDEKKSFEDYEQKMFESFGENYRGYKIVSAKVAFLALADCVLEKSLIYDERNDFLNEYQLSELLEKTFFNNLCKFITDEMVVNTKQKIKKSNYNKASNLLEELINVLDTALKENFEPLYNDLVKEVDSSSNNLKNTSRKLKIDLESIVEKNLRDFESNTRKEIYSHIEKNVSDDSFKNKLELLLKENLEKIKKTIPIDIENQISKFQNSIIDVLENFKRRVDNVIQDYQTFNFDSKFNINLQIDNGIDKMGLTGSLLGAGGLAYSAIMFGNSWNPVGWTMFGIAVVTVIIGAFKSLKKWWSDDYKKSEQRNSADENLSKIMENIKPKIMENTKPVLNDISVQIDYIINDLGNILNQRRIVNEYIKESSKNLKQTAKQIKSEGNK